MYQKIKNLCEEKGISIYSLEKELGLSTGSVIKWHKSVPRIETLQKLSKYFDVSIEYFLDKGDETNE